MAASRNIKGITIEIGGDTTGLQNALSSVNKEIKDTQSQLKDVEKLLKFDPTNTELLTQKQSLLTDAVDETKKKLETLKTASEQAAASAKNYDAWKAAYDPIQEQIDKTKTKITELKENMKTLEEGGKIDTDEYKNLQKELEESEQSLKELKTQAKETSDEFGNPISTEQYQALQREIIATEQQLQSLEGTAGSASATLAGISAATEKFGTSASKIGQELTDNVTSKVVDFGKTVIETTAEFESSMSNVQAISGATTEEIEVLSQKAREMGANTKYSASEAADAMSYMAMAGWDAEEMIGGIEGVMYLAAASGEDLATTSDIVTDALTAFGLEADDATHFADVLAKTSSSANTDVSMMGETFKYVAPLAGTLGYTVEDMATAIGIMANSGIKASTAGTSLRQAISNLVAPSETMADAMAALGFYTEETITTFDQQDIDQQMTKVESATLAVMKAQDSYNDAVSEYGEESNEAVEALMNLEIKSDNLRYAQEKLEALQSGEVTTILGYNQAIQNGDETMKELSETVDFLKDSFSGMSEAEQAQYAATIFGQRAMSGMLAVINSSEEDYNELADAIYHCDGAAEDMANTMNDNLEGDIITLQSALSELAISIGEMLMPIVRDIVDVVKNVVDKLNGMSDTAKTIIIVIAAIVAAVGPFLVTIGQIALGISAVTKAFSTLKTMNIITGLASKVSGAFSSLFSILAANPIIIVVAAVAALVAIFVTLYNKCDWFREAVDKIWVQIKEMFFVAWDAITNFFTNTLPSIWDSVVLWFEGIPAWWSNLWQGIGDFFSEIWNGILENPIIQAIINDISTKWNNIVTNLSTIWSNLQMAAGAAWELIKNIVLAPVLLLMDLISGNFENLKSDAQSIWENIKEAASTIWESIVTIITLFVDNLKIAIMNGIENVKVFLSEAWEFIKTTAGNVWESLSTVVVETVTNLISSIQQGWEDLKENATRAWEDLKENAKQAWEDLKTNVVNTVTNLKDSVVEGIQNMIASIKQWWSDLKTNTKQAWSDLKNNVVTTATNLKNSAMQIFDNMRTKIKNTVSKIKESVINGFQEAIKFITNLPSQAKQWGADFVQGIVDGIKGMIKKVQDAASSVAETIRSFLHFSVPDKGPLTDYESWMPDFMKGLAQGIERSKSMVTDAMTNLTQDMQIGATGIVETNRRNDTSQMDNLLSVLNQYLPYLAQAKNIVLDSGELVGGLAPAMNKQLQVLSLRERNR